MDNISIDDPKKPKTTERKKGGKKCIECGTFNLLKTKNST